MTNAQWGFLLKINLSETKKFSDSLLGQTKYVYNKLIIDLTLPTTQSKLYNLVKHTAQRHLNDVLRRFYYVIETQHNHSDQPMHWFTLYMFHFFVSKISRPNCYVSVKPRILSDSPVMLLFGEVTRVKGIGSDLRLIFELFVFVCWDGQGETLYRLHSSDVKVTSHHIRAAWLFRSSVNNYLSSKLSKMVQVIH